ncbi:MAG: hypothetical protein GY879_13275 [Planctomycetes bacterium]|nr:hypothetical protein [Planctomycetota bacterium]MCP4861529.1 hypothetical protein [Planctomycetota bacterium]
MISFLTLALFALPQEPIDEPTRLKPLIPPPAQTEPSPKGPDKTTAKPKTPKPARPKAPQQGTIQAFGGGQQNQAFGPQQLQDSGKGPRPMDNNLKPPFDHNRTLLKVNGVPIRASEINDLVMYYRSYRPGRSDMQLTEAVKALIPLKVMSAHFKDDLPTMIDQVDDAYAAIVGGEDFKAVAIRYSQDSEAPTDDGRYTFARERAVQPFDRYSFTLPLNQLSPPFLTVYGFHLVEVLDYERGQMPADDKSTMRHILIMYPGMIALEKEGKDVRKWIKEQVKLAKFEVLEAGMENLVPAANRKQIVRD